MVSIFLPSFAACIRFGGWIVAALAVAALAACGSAAPVAKEPVNLMMRVAASDRSNPDEWGRAAPIMVRIYELKSSTAFENADFFTLQTDDKKVLSDDALVVDEFILRPGDTRKIARKSDPAATAIGVLAGYRELGKYRMVVPDKKQKLTIFLDQHAASISESN
jgi:type VI secretion system protein VasD